MGSLVLVASCWSLARASSHTHTSITVKKKIDVHDWRLYLNATMRLLAGGVGPSLVVAR
jgi:hypothetical protein